MTSSKRILALLALVLGLAVAPATFADNATLLSEDFTGATSSNNGGTGNWLFFNGACLTAGTSTSLSSPASSIPACTAVLNSYYINAADHDQYLMGGANGYLGGSSPPGSPATQAADPVGNGALRFTNGKPYGNQERGAIVSTNAYSTGSGIQVTFKTVTYGGTGADGISFYLMDGCVPVAGAVMPSGCASSALYPSASSTLFPAIGATGGSLAYTCSNTNGPGSGAGVTYDGLTGGYLGLGIDEYGNFLNQGDNTSSGYGFQPGRIGLRGAGAISWPALNNAYGTDPGSSTKPFYPSWLASSCSSGVLDKISGTCGVCPAIGPTSTTTGLVTTATTTTTVYTNAQCANTTTTTTTTADTGCTTSGYTLQMPNGNPVCVKTSGCTYNLTNNSTYPNGVCTNAFKASPPAAPNTCSTSGYSYVPGLITTVCVKQPTTNTSFSNTVGTSTVTNNVAPTSSVPFTPNVTAIQSAMQKTCSSGHLWNYSNSTPTDAGPATLSTDPTSPNAYNTAGILDYAPIPLAYTILPSGNPLFNGSATKRSQATTIFYNLKITSDGFLSLSYAYNGGTYQQVITNQNIKAANGPIPNYVRFGFAGSTGGATNVHEIMCFKSAPAVTSGSSAGVNEKQSAKVESGTFAYFAYYDQNNWVGRATANALTADATTGVVTVAATPAWDASCNLTGVIAGQKCTTGVAGPTAAMDPTTRVIFSYNGGGIPFEWGNLSTAQQASLTTGDPTSTAYRLNYLRGDRTNEITSAFGTCSGGSPVCFRARTSVLADIVDSSPTWVGPPQAPYTAVWKDSLIPAGLTPENSGTQNYQQFVAAEQTRPNIVYVGSNDGMMHGFRSGASDSTGTFSTATTPNDGQEVIAYMPGSLLLSAGTGGACASLSATGSVVQNIHGVTPANGATPACVTPALDFSGTQYGHNFFMNATPGTGDLFYNNTWHTWLVSGLAGGGAALFALDVTDPTASTFTESTTNAAKVVVGEWTSSNITCVGNSTCGTNMGALYGTPIIRRLHDGRWAVIFGNGYQSATGDAGVFVMTVDSSGNKLFYYLSTGNTGTANNNGIAYVSSADLDGDHITDYLYAGDLMGNLWRFDLTSATEANWAVSPGPLFTTPTGQPITTAVVAAAGGTAAGGSTLVLSFGTGLRNQFNNAAAVSYQTTGQSLYGVWDWNMSSWNSKSTTQYASLPGGSTGLVAPNFTLGQSNLQQQTFTLNADGITRDIVSPTPICWAGTAACSTTPKFGWFLNLIGTKEQIIFNPQLLGGVFTVNSIVPANNQVNSCSVNNDTGFTYAISVLTGASSPNFFISYHDAIAGGVQLGAVGTSSAVTSPNGTVYLIYQTFTGAGGATATGPQPNGKGRRLTWVQLR